MINGRLVRRQRLSLSLWISALATLATGCGSGPDYDEIAQVTVVDRQVAIDVAPAEERDGPELVRIRDLAAEVDDPPLYVGEIANEGGELTLDNIRPDTSDAPNLRLCLNGAGQGDLYVRINVFSKTVTEIPRECTE